MNSVKFYDDRSTYRCLIIIFYDSFFNYFLHEQKQVQIAF